MPTLNQGMTENEEPLTEEQKQDRALVATWQKVIKDAKDNDLFKNYHTEIKEERRRVQGFKSGELKGNERVRANLIYANLAAMLPHIYARNPEIVVTPSEAADQKVYSWIKPFTQTATVVINRLLKDAQIKKVGKVAVRSAQTTRIGWMKATYQREYDSDPVIQNRINDVQDNLKYIEQLQAQIERPEDQEHQEANKAQLEHSLKSLMQKVEVAIAEGMVLDRILSEDMLWDPSVREFEFIIDQAGWMAHRIWFKADKFEATFGRKPSSKAATYTASKTEQKNLDQTKAEYAVWEIWHKDGNTVFTICEGDIDFCRAPYSPENVGERWYPFFGQGLHPTDGHPLPMSSVGLLKKLQDEYDETRDDYAEHRKKNVPHYIADADIDEKSIQRKQHAGIGEIVLVDANGKPLSQVFQKAEGLNVDPAQYDTTPIRYDMEVMSGLQDGAKGAVAKAKTATEAEILQAGLTSRTSEQQDAIEDLFEDLGTYTLEIALLELSPEIVKRIAGPGAVWPQMSRDQIFDLVNVEIRAGTSGKPNKAQEQKTWLEFMPQLTELITKVSELRQQGQNELADALIKVSRETIRRFDERIDVEEFMPEAGEEQQPSPEEQMNLMQQFERMKKELEQLEANIRKTHAEAEGEEIENVITAATAGLGLPTNSTGETLQ